MVVQIIEGKDKGRHQDLLATMFRARYEAFIVERGWSLPARHGLEVDQYDNDRSVYIVDLDDAGYLQGSVRLTPTVTDSLTADYYPHLSDSITELRDPCVYEGTRYIACPREKTPQSNRVVKARVLGAMTEWAFSVGVHHIQAVIDTALARSFKATNSKTFALGPARDYGGGRGVPGGGTCLAIRIPVSERAINEVRAYGALKSSPAPEPYAYHPASEGLRHVA